MEEELQPGKSASDDVRHRHETAVVARRRRALAMFLNNPQGAADEFPDLIGGLRMFVKLSTNPFADAYDNRIAKAGSEQSFDEWNRARDWEKEQRNDA